MQPDLIHDHRLDRYSGRGSSPLHRAGPRQKLILALLVVLLIAIVQPSWWPVSSAVPLSWVHVSIAVALVLSLHVAAIPWRYVGRRLAWFALPLALVGASIPLAQGAAGWPLLLTVLVKGCLSFTTVLILVNTTGFARLLSALRGCGVPALFVAMLAGMYRYLFVLLDEMERMRRARRARSFDTSRTMSRSTLRFGTTLIGMLLVRSTERAERVHAAMLARGFAGEFRTLDDPQR